MEITGILSAVDLIQNHDRIAVGFVIHAPLYINGDNFRFCRKIGVLMPEVKNRGEGEKDSPSTKISGAKRVRNCCIIYSPLF